jgi:hypothetical protein
MTLSRWESLPLPRFSAARHSHEFRPDWAGVRREQERVVWPRPPRTVAEFVREHASSYAADYGKPTPGIESARDVHRKWSNGRGRTGSLTKRRVAPHPSQRHRRAEDARRRRSAGVHRTYRCSADRGIRFTRRQAPRRVQAAAEVTSAGSPAVPSECPELSGAVSPRPVGPERETLKAAIVPGVRRRR